MNLPEDVRAEKGVIAGKGPGQAGAGLQTSVQREKGNGEQYKDEDGGGGLGASCLIPYFVDGDAVVIWVSEALYQDEE